MTYISDFYTRKENFLLRRWRGPLTSSAGQTKKAIDIGRKKGHWHTGGICSIQDLQGEYMSRNVNFPSKNKGAVGLKRTPIVSDTIRQFCGRFTKYSNRVQYSFLEDHTYGTGVPCPIFNTLIILFLFNLVIKCVEGKYKNTWLCHRLNYCGELFNR